MGCCRTCSVSFHGDDPRKAEKFRKISSEEDYRAWLPADVENDEDHQHPSIKFDGEQTVMIGWRSLDSSPGTLVRFSFSEIRSATRDFDSGRLLGIGAASKVYKGKFETESKGRRVSSVAAVKRLLGEKRECGEAFCREIIAGDYRHPNIVPLLGYCVDPGGLFLVYKFAAFGSLDYVLHPVIEREDEGRREKERKRGLSLSWEDRWKVAVGIGRALEYLHRGTKNCVIHRDIKPANILLSSRNTPMLSDFGMSVWTRGSSLPIFCKTVEGTFGYLAPEYFHHGKLSDKSDVFSFGILLLELISGRRPIDPDRSPGDKNLLLWAKPLLRRGKEGLEALSDRRLKNKEGSSGKNKLLRMVHTSMACLREDDTARPSIGAAIRMLLRGQDSELPVFTGKSPQLRSDMTRHLNLAMKELSDVDETEVD